MQAVILQGENMISIGFIEPSSEYLFDPFRGDPFTHFYILTILEDHFGSQIQAKLIDLRGIKKEFAIYHIPECDIYLHSVYTLDYNEQLFLVKTIQETYPKSIHLAGGPHVREFTRENMDIFDSLILGEGEIIIVKAVEDFLGGRLQKIYQEKIPVDINAYPFGRRNFLPKSITARKNMVGLRKKQGFENLIGTTVIFSRGCPYSCHFCALRQSREDFPGIRYRSPDNVKKEIEYLKKEFNVKAIVLQDEICVPLRKDLARTHLEAIGETGIIWRGQCRVDGVTEETAKLMKASGCIAMGMGVESVNQLSLNIINKNIDIERSRKTIELLKRNDIEVRIYMIMGLPGEPTDIVDQTWKFIEETNPDLVVLSLFTVRPGTEMYNNPNKFGLKLLKTDWSKTMHMWSRYDNEEPTLTFEYLKDQGLPNQTIIKNYLELQKRLKERNIGTAFYKK